MHKRINSRGSNISKDSKRAKLTQQILQSSPNSEEKLSAYHQVLAQNEERKGSSLSPTRELSREKQDEIKKKLQERAR